MFDINCESVWRKCKYDRITYMYEKFAKGLNFFSEKTTDTSSALFIRILYMYLHTCLYVYMHEWQTAFGGLDSGRWWLRDEARRKSLKLVVLNRQYGMSDVWYWAFIKRQWFIFASVDLAVPEETFSHAFSRQVWHKRAQGHPQIIATAKARGRVHTTWTTRKDVCYLNLTPQH